MSHMTRIARVVEHLKIFGPMTTHQIGTVFDWPLNTASSVMSQAKAYGYVKAVGHLPPQRIAIGGCRLTVWGVE